MLALLEVTIMRNRIAAIVIAAFAVAGSIAGAAATAAPAVSHGSAPAVSYYH